MQSNLWFSAVPPANVPTPNPGYYALFISNGADSTTAGYVHKKDSAGVVTTAVQAPSTYTDLMAQNAVRGMPQDLYVHRTAPEIRSNPAILTADPTLTMALPVPGTFQVDAITAYQTGPQNPTDARAAWSFTGTRTGSSRFRAGALAAPNLPPMGTATLFSVLAYTTVANDGGTNLGAAVGTYPGTVVTGFPPGTYPAGETVHNGDPTAQQAMTDVTAAFTDASTRVPTGSFSGDQIGVTFRPGVYKTVSAFALTGTMTLDGDGDPNSVFIFQIDSAMNTAAASVVKCVNGAQPSHVFWWVTGAVGTGASSVLVGTILAQGAVTIGSLATLAGRIMSLGTVTLAANAITTPPRTRDIGDTTMHFHGDADFATPYRTGVNGAVIYCTERLIITTSTAGTVAFLWGPSNATALTMLAGSHMTVKRLAN